MMAGNCEERPNQPQANGISPSSKSRESLLTLDQKNSSSDLFISISGLIGAGKSTLATKLAERMNLPVFYEPVIDNVYLSDFYKDPARFSFPLQVRAALGYLAMYNHVVCPKISMNFFATGVSTQPSVSTAPTDHLDRKRRSPGQDHLRGLCIRQGNYHHELPFLLQIVFRECVCMCTYSRVKVTRV